MKFIFVEEKLFTLTRLLKPQISEKMCKMIYQSLKGNSTKWCPKKFITQEISHIIMDGDMKLSTVSNYMKEFLSIIEIENKKCHIWYNKNTPIEIVSDKLVMSLDGLNSSNLLRQIDHPNYTSMF